MKPVTDQRLSSKHHTRSGIFINIIDRYYGISTGNYITFLRICKAAWEPLSTLSLKRFNLQDTRIITYQALV